MKCQTARKEHRCDLCGQPIKKGERYWNDHQPVTPVSCGYTRREHINCIEHEKKLTADVNGGAT